MGEAYISRRGGESGSGGSANIYLQTSQPDYTRGGLWVKTTLNKYETIDKVISTPYLSGKSYNLEYEWRTNIGHIIYNGYLYWGYLETSSGPYKIKKLNLYSGTYTILATPYNNYTDNINFYIYNNLLYALTNEETTGSIKYSFVISIDGGAISKIPFNSRIHQSVVINELVFPIMQYNSSYNLEDTTANIYNVSLDTYSLSYIINLPRVSNIVLTIPERNICYIYQSVANFIILNYRTGVTSTVSFGTSAISGSRWLGYGYYNNLMICSFIVDMTGDIRIFNMDTNTFTWISSYKLPDMPYRGWAMTGNKVWGLSSNKATEVILGNKTWDSTKVYIDVSGTTKNSRIVSSDNSYFDVPILAVYSAPSGTLQPQEAYVSTGGAWAKI